MKQNILWLLLLVVAGLASCRDDDPIGVVEMDNLLQYEFPQGTNEWDKEIEQIAVETRRIIMEMRKFAELT